MYVYIANPIRIIYNINNEPKFKLEGDVLLRNFIVYYSLVNRQVFTT